MCSYNRINGVHSCANNQTLHADLRGTLGFRGFIVSDWGATGAGSLAASQDMEMPGGGTFNRTLRGQILSGQVPVATLDRMVRRILAPLAAVGALDRPPCPDCVHTVNASSAAGNRAARAAATAGMVLLKNAGRTLPVASAVKRLVVVGPGAHERPTVSQPYGSGQVDGSRLVTPLQGLRAQARPGLEITHIPLVDTANASAMAQLRDADLALVFVGTTAGEGHDRPNLTLCADCGQVGSCPAARAPDRPGGCWQDEMVAKVAVAARRTAVVVSTPGAVLLPWRDAVGAVLVAWLPGQEFGSAVADILYGTSSPSGKLPLTMPCFENQLNMSALQYPGHMPNTSDPRRRKPDYANYTEKLEVGYRWFNAHGVQPAYSFGHGLSYTTFEFAGLRVAASGVSLMLTNNGTVPGAEVVQLYLDFPAAAGEPPNQLKGFQKVHLDAGASATVTIPLAPRDFSVWSVEARGWVVAHGEFGVAVGSSSADRRLVGKLTV